MNDKRLDELLAGRALHALSPEEERELEAALAADPELRERAERDDEVASALAEATPELAPPAFIRDQLLARIADPPAEQAGASPAKRGDAPAGDSAVPADDPADASIGEPPAPRSRRIRRRFFVLAASVAVVAAVGIGSLFAFQAFDRPEAVVALEQISGADDSRATSEPMANGGTLEVHWSHEVGEVVVVAEGVPQLEDGRQYELWFVRDETPVSAGVFDGGADAPILLEGELAPGDIVAVTIEDAGGSPTGAPTTDPVVAISTE